MKDDDIKQKLEELEALEELLRKRKQELLKKRTPQTLMDILDSLPWKSFKNHNGQWTYATDASGHLRPELKGIEKFITYLKKNGKVQLRGYEYRMSGKNDNFLNRYEIEKKEEEKKC